MLPETLHALRAGQAALAPQRALWRLSGPDRVRYLNGQVTNDVKSLHNGHALHAAACTPKGRLQADLAIAADRNALWIDAPLEIADAAGARIERYLIADDAILENVTSAWKLLHILGEPAAPNAEGGMAFQSERFGSKGWDLWLPLSATPPLPLASPDDLETFRILQGLPRWGREMDETTLPQEMRFDQAAPLAISYTKGCYTGQETIARIKSIGHVNRLLCKVACDQAWQGELPAPCLSGETKVGTLTSTCAHPENRNATLGLAILQRAQTLAGSTFEAGGAVWRVTS